MSARRVHIVGVGQPYGGDDGVGRAVAARLKAVGVQGVSEASDGPGVLELLLGGEPAPDHMIIIDAYADAEAAGEVRVLDRAELAGGVASVSSHALSVPTALDMAEALGCQARITIVGVAIEPPVGLREGLSESVSDAVPHAVAQVKRLLDGLEGGARA